MRVPAYIKKIIEDSRSIERQTETLKINEIQIVSVAWITDSQTKHFSEAIRDRQDDGNKKINLLKQFKLYIDKDNLIRCERRILKAQLDESSKFLLLLAEKDLYCVTTHCQRRTCFLSLLRIMQFCNIKSSKLHVFDLSAIRQTVKSVIRKCRNSRIIIIQILHLPTRMEKSKRYIFAYSRAPEHVPFI